MEAATLTPAGRLTLEQARTLLVGDGLIDGDVVKKRQWGKNIGKFLRQKNIFQRTVTSSSRASTGSPPAATED